MVILPGRAIASESAEGGTVLQFNILAIESRLVELRTEHRDLDLAIGALVSLPVHDQLQLKRLKKRKLLLKDQIAFLEGQLHPDVPA